GAHEPSSAGRDAAGTVSIYEEAPRPSNGNWGAGRPGAFARVRANATTPTATTGRMILSGTGFSTGAHTALAAAEAGAQAAASLGGGPADFAVAFASVEHAGELPHLLASLEHAVGTPYVVGCSAAGVIVSGREIEEGPAIGVLAVRSDALRGTPF